jgi:hypothetical protein
MNEMCLPPSLILDELGLQLVELFERKESTEGATWYVDDYDNGELIHAQLYRMGDCYDIPGLCELALHRFSKHDETTFDAEVNRDAVHYLMSNTPHEDTKVRMRIVHLLDADLERFDIRSHAKDLLDQHPFLKDYLLHGMFHDDVASEYCWGSIAQSIEPPEHVKKVEVTDTNIQEDDQGSRGREAYVQIGGAAGA